MRIRIALTVVSLSLIAACSSGPTATGVPVPTEATTRDGCDAAALPLERRARLMVFAELTTDAPDLGADTVRSGVGGVFIAGSAIGVLRAPVFHDALTSTVPGPFVAIDEEGGTVQRLGAAGWIPTTPSARAMGATMTTGQIRAQGAATGAGLASFGITMDFAPTVDVGTPDGPMGSRAFSGDAGAVATDAVAFARGLVDAGVTPVLKHFPGHGRASGDTHDGLATTPGIEALRAVDLVPFRDGIAAVPQAAIMVGHLAVPGVTDGEPASLSHAAIADLLRGEIGFDGLVITDDLGAMRAILDRHTPADAGVRAAIAGADLVLVPVDAADAVVAGIVDAAHSGRVDETRITESANRVLRHRPGADCL